MSSTIYSIKVPEFVKDEPLGDLIRVLETIYQTSIEQTVTVTLNTSSQPALTALQAIFRQNGDDLGKQVLATLKSNGGKPQAEKRTLPAWNIEGTDEKFSQQSLNVRLRDHALEPGTKLHYPKHGKKVVIADSARACLPWLGQAPERFRTLTFFESNWRHPGLGMPFGLLDPSLPVSQCSPRVPPYTLGYGAADVLRTWLLQVASMPPAPLRTL